MLYVSGISVMLGKKRDYRGNPTMGVSVIPFFITFQVYSWPHFTLHLSNGR